MKRTIDTDAAPAAVGAYSQGTETDDLVFTAGQIPLTPDGDLLDWADVDVQTEQSLANIEAVLDATGVGTNDVYGTYFGDEPPARGAVEVGALPRGVAVEVEAVATE